MQIHVFDSAERCGQAAATLIVAQLLSKPNCVLGLATGSTPIPTYQMLIQMHKEGLVDFSKAHSFNLDEYVGIPPTHPCSYHAFMQEQLFDYINMPQANIHLPSGLAEDLAKEGAAYDAAIQLAGGIDLQILGIGENGHIGFNEPDAHFTYECHAVELTESTIRANRRFFDSEQAVPKRAISMGIGGIMSARQILLLATGEGKAEAVRGAIHGEVTPQLPASILRTHPNTIFLLDKGAAKKL